MILAPLENQLTIDVRVYFWDLFSVPLAARSMSCGFVVCFSIKKCETFNFVLVFFKTAFGYLGFFEIPYALEDGLSYFRQQCY